MELNFRRAIQVGRAFPQEIQGGGELPLLIQNPPQRVSDGRIRRSHLPGLARQLVALVKIAQIFRVKKRQIVQHHAIFWSQNQQLFISLARALVVFLRVVGHAHEHQCDGILRVFSQCRLEFAYCLLVLIGGGVELGQHQICLMGIRLQRDGF